MIEHGPDGSWIEKGIDAMGRDYKRTSNDFKLKRLQYNNCSCSICHALGAKWAFEYIVRDYSNYSARKVKICKNLQSHEKLFWICPECIKNMERSTGIKIQFPAENTEGENND